MQRVRKRLKRKEVTKLRESKVLGLAIASVRTQIAIPWAVCMSIKIKGIENARRGKLFELVSITHSEYNRVFTKSQSKFGVY